MDEDADAGKKNPADPPYQGEEGHVQLKPCYTTGMDGELKNFEEVLNS
jgi:hypothetical protein